MSRFVKLLIAAGLSLCLLNCPSTPKPPENKTADPIFSPSGGTFTEAVTVEIKSSTEGAEIRYTVDGTEPSSTVGIEYTAPVKIEKTTKLAAIAYKKDFPDSSVSKATFEIKAEAVAAVEPISDDEVLQVRNAIARAKEADATYYDPDNLNEAEQLLDDALAAREADPAKAREQLAAAKEKADLAFQNSVEREAASLAERMKTLNDVLLEKQADKYLPTEYGDAVAGIDEATQFYADGEIALARSRA